MQGKSPKLVLDAERTALLIIDVQRALFSRPTPIYKADNLIHNINSLIEIWQHSSVLVVYIQHSNNKMLIKNSTGWQFHPDLSVNETDIVIPKVHGNAFKETNLNDVLDSSGIENIVITGLVTQGCVRATCIGGNELGFRVILVEDGHSNYRKDAHEIIERCNLELGKENVELFSTDEIDLV
jgi:nicotinamidase-related amidase